jgi:hypothetical protein
MKILRIYCVIKFQVSKILLLTIIIVFSSSVHFCILLPTSPKVPYSSALSNHHSTMCFYGLGCFFVRSFTFGHSLILFKTVLSKLSLTGFSSFIWQKNIEPCAFTYIYNFTQIQLFYWFVSGHLVVFIASLK